MKDQIELLFTQVLMICDREGLIGRNMFAIDGCKIRSNASKEWSGTFGELERKQAKLRRASQRILTRHQAQDSLGEDEITHDLKQQAKLDKSANKIKDFLATNEEKRGSRNTPVKSNITDPDSAKMTTRPVRVPFKMTTVLRLTMINIKSSYKHKHGAQLVNNKP